MMLDDFSIQTLSEKGANNALHVAVCNRSENAVHFLLSGGIDRNAQSESGDAAVHQAILYPCLPILRLLCTAEGINLNIQNRQGKTALQLAVEQHLDDYVACLLDAGADPHIEDNEQVSAAQLMHLGMRGMNCA